MSASHIRRSAIWGAGLLVLLFVGSAIIPTTGSSISEGSRMGSAARSIHLGLLDANMERAAMGQSEVWPQVGDFASSTAFLNHCLRERIIKGAAPYFFTTMTRNRDDRLPLRQSENAWCITLGVTSSTPPNTPFLFTRNFIPKGTGREAMTLGAINGLARRLTWRTDFGVGGKHVLDGFPSWDEVKRWEEHNKAEQIPCRRRLNGEQHERHAVEQRRR